MTEEHLLKEIAELRALLAAANRALEKYEKATNKSQKLDSCRCI